MPDPTLKIKANHTDCSHCATLATCLLGGMAPSQIRALESVISKKSFVPGDALTREGEATLSIKIVKVGTVIGYRLGRDGRARPIGLFGRGVVFGLFGFYGHANQATNIAASAGRVCEIPMDELKMQTAGIPEFAELMREAILHSVSRIAAWSECMRVRGAVNQLAYTLLLLGDAQDAKVVRLPSQDALAELLGSSRETIARALATLENEGAIRRVETKTYELFEGTLIARLGGDLSQPPLQ